MRTFHTPPHPPHPSFLVFYQKKNIFGTTKTRLKTSGRCKNYSHKVEKYNLILIGERTLGRARRKFNADTAWMEKR